MKNIVQNIGQMCAIPTHKNYKLWQRIVNVFILTSCIGLALQTVPSCLSEYKTIFNILEWVTVAIFTLDYISNLFYSEKKFKYAFSVWGIIDLISILPSYLIFLNLSVLQGARMLRLLRTARMLRIILDVDAQKISNPLIANLKVYLIIFWYKFNLKY